MKSTFLWVLFILLSLKAQSIHTANFEIGYETLEIVDYSLETSKPKPLLFKNLILRLKGKKDRNHKAVAASLAVTLGPFGAHRIYLGTDYSVPLFYTITLGGGMGILPLCDLILILSAKDISKYYDNPHIFMWEE